MAHAELFFVAAQFQNRWTWALVDTGSSRNLMSLVFYHQLLYQPPLRAPHSFRVLAGNGQPLDLSGIGVFTVSLNGFWMYHDFVVVRDLPLDAVLGGELLRPHSARLKYCVDERNVVELETSCPACEINRGILRDLADPQLKYTHSQERGPGRRGRRRQGIAVLVAIRQEDFDPDTPAVSPGKEIPPGRQNRPGRGDPPGHSSAPGSESPPGRAEPPGSYRAPGRRVPPGESTSPGGGDSPTADTAPGSGFLPGEEVADSCSLSPRASAPPGSVILPGSRAPRGRIKAPGSTEEPGSTIASGFQPLPEGQISFDVKLEKVLSELRVSSLDVSETVRRDLVEVVRRFLDVFAASPMDVGRTHVIRHRIETGENQAFKEKYRPPPLAWRAFLDQEIDRLLAIGHISEADPGECPYSSRSVIVRKKDGSFRLCIDYRRLNAQTVKDAYPLPRIDEILASLEKARCFAALDLLMGYHEVEVEPCDRAKTAFVTHKGLFVWNVMPFGLTNAPATFQRLMNQVLQGLVGDGVLVYLDDVLIFAENYPELLSRMCRVFERLRAAGLKCKPTKCQLCLREIEYLGHVVSEGRVRPDPAKVLKIVEWPTPRNGSELASFLGLCNYYRPLIAEFAGMADPLYKSVQLEPFEWTRELERSFAELKRALASDCVVKIPQSDVAFALETDASLIALGAVLKQKFPVGGEYPVSFFSRALTAPERRYSVYERELLAVVRACEHFRVFLLGRPFVVRTDHGAIKKIFTSKLRDSMRVEKWVLRLAEYEFSIEQIPGRENIVADALSRIPDELPPPAPSLPAWAASPEGNDGYGADDPELFAAELEVGETGTVHLEGITLDAIREAQEADPEYKLVLQWTRRKKYPEGDALQGLSPFLRSCVEAREFLSLHEGVLMINDDDGAPVQRMIVPPQLIDTIIQYFHEGPAGAHEATSKLHERVSRQYWWPYMRRDIAIYVAACDKCASFRHPAKRPQAPLQPIRVGSPNELVAVDLMGGKESLPETSRKNRYIFVAIDAFTKYAVAVPLYDQTAQSVARAMLSAWILVFGPPRRIHSDQGLCFESSIFEQLCTTWRIAKSRTNAYHPQCNGVCERVNQTIKNSLRRVQVPDHPDDWDLTLPSVMFAYNTSIHSSTGFTPFFLTHGCEARLPSDLVLPVVDRNSGSYASTLVHVISSACAVARETLRTHQQREKDYYDSGVVFRLFQPGDVVRLRIENLFAKPASKLASPWTDQHEVIEVRGVTVKVRNLKTDKTLWVHHDRLSNPQVFRERILPPRAEPGNARPSRKPPGKQQAGLPDETFSISARSVSLSC